MVRRMANLRMLSLLLCTALACGDDDGTADSGTTTSEPATGSSGSTGPSTPGTTAGDTTAGEPDSTGETPVTTSGPDTTSDDTSGDSTTAGVASASASLEPKSGSEASGSAVFTDNGDGTADLVVDLQGVLPPGTHALHIHVNPDCSADDGTSAGDHWNPPGTQLGELGTVEIAQDGTGTFTKSDAWSIGTGAENDVVGHSIIIHEDPNGGTRLACGVIQLD